MNNLRIIYTSLTLKGCVCVSGSHLNTYIQGHSQHLSENNSLLLTKYESERLPEPTGGSPDVVHLIKYASLVFRWLPMLYTDQDAKETDV